MPEALGGVNWMAAGGVVVVTVGGDSSAAGGLEVTAAGGGCGFEHVAPLEVIVHTRPAQQVGMLGLQPAAMMRQEGGGVLKALGGVDWVAAGGGVAAAAGGCGETGALMQAS